MKRILALILSISLLSACGAANHHLDEETVAAYKDSISEAKKLLKSDMSDGDRIETLGSIAVGYDTLGQEKKAIPYYEDILQIEESHYVALNNLTVIYEDIEDYEMAAAYATQLSTYHGDQSEVIKDTIRILCKAGEFDTALRALENFARIHMQDPKYTTFISEQFEYIARMRTAAEAKQAE